MTMMKAIVALVVLLTFVAVLPRRHLPPRVFPGTSVAACETGKLLDRFYLVLPPVKRETGEIEAPVSSEDGVTPAYGTACFSYAIAFYSILSNGLFGMHVLQFIKYLIELMFVGFIVSLIASLLCAVVYSVSSVFRFANPCCEDLLHNRSSLPPETSVEVPRLVICCLLLVGIGLTVSIFVSR